MKSIVEIKSIFTDTGDNMNIRENALREKKEIALLSPGWARKLRYIIIFLYRVRRLFSGAYRSRLIKIGLYLEGVNDRVWYNNSPSFLWEGR